MATIETATSDDWFGGLIVRVYYEEGRDVRYLLGNIELWDAEGIMVKRKIDGKLVWLPSRLVVKIEEELP